MRLSCPLIGLSFSAALCASAHAQTPSPAAPASAYDEQAVGVRNLTPLPTAGRSALPDTPWDAFQGRDHHPIDEEAFFRIVGRDDLLHRYHREAVVKKSLSIGGGTLVFGGLLFAAVTAALRYGGGQPADLCMDNSCPSANSRGPSPVWGLAIAGAGAVSLIVGHLLDPTPIDADEADSLARDYDRSLQSRRGISETAARE